MIALIDHYSFGLLLALLIGIATGWWVWGGRRAVPLAEQPIAWPARDPAAPASRDAPGDDLTVINGIDVEIALRLRGLGVTRFAQIAAWMPEDIERIDSAMGAFRGRLIRDEWIAQARLLARGDPDAFEQLNRYFQSPAQPADFIK
ncbi:MAG TPA: hypothetical protein VNS79_08720 [Sphingobium sp.]|nr:hypothetical protein [Sphingobium sp.]